MDVSGENMLAAMCQSMDPHFFSQDSKYYSKRNPNFPAPPTNFGGFGISGFYETSPSAGGKDEEGKAKAAAESCLVILKRSGAVGWGVQRKITYFARRGSKEEPAPKRAREIPSKKAMKKPKVERGRPCKGSSDRWSSERYLAAEMKLVEIMKEKGAALGRPILRPELREAARKHIGDTGLLDHLLKHMAGKAVGEGRERFRRRHNPEGAMEYWLEPAELQDLRRAAGVMDPFWVPPPGWQPGDLISPCGKEIDLLKQQLSSLKREVDGLRSAGAEEKEARERGDAAGVLRIQESCKNLMKSNGKLEEQVTAMSRQLQSLQEELKKMKSEEWRIQRERMGRRSGFRICKPEGTFLWPNMAGEGTTNSSTTGDDRSAVPATPPSACSATSPPSIATAHRAKVVVLTSAETPGCSDVCSPAFRKVPVPLSYLSASPIVDQGSWEVGPWGRSVSTELALSSPCYRR